ncbi:RHS repeat domain-containing protein [Natronoglycomyces albus]|uniref:Teneurin-like YD-shell domain-containing protein n=1 Tax=Natronoglycomyces albus TaxID=2811108 RepID=A0A895XRS1_9ACTN|nr:RHS repeat-associated core domain-containing protein [Natronoglycomyces albus]QSB06039.1 hypothetical protein JQS30_03700 [Natronoglycomyces albus]
MRNPLSSTVPLDGRSGLLQPKYSLGDRLRESMTVFSAALVAVVLIVVFPLPFLTDEGERSAPTVPSVPVEDIGAISPDMADTDSWQGADAAAWPSEEAFSLRSENGSQSRSHRFSTLNRQQATDAGFAGPVVVAQGLQGDDELTFEVDYSGFAQLYGGGWADRLTVSALIDCQMVRDHRSDCEPVSEVSVSKDRVGQSLTATVGQGWGSADNHDVTFAVSAADSGESGSWTATDLAPSGTWSHGGSSGGFTHSYATRTPPSIGPVPEVGLSYSSQSHDGRTSGSNNQASWIGDGWNYDPGFIERTYTPCARDDEDGNNADHPSGDLCWDGDSPSLTLSLNGGAQSLVLDDATGQWRTASDANWRIQHRGSPASSGSGTTERWIVTLPDGTRYFFAGEASSSSSRWTVPVYGNHSGEPCYQSNDFEGSRCNQAYRWMLDKIIDVHGNMARFYYDTETGHYAAAADQDNRVSYTRSGWPTKIEYGLRSDDSSIKPTGRVLFDITDRCLEDCYDSSDEPKPESWPDTPWDLACEGTPCEQFSPSFFSTKKLEKISTQVRTGSSFTNVDSWELRHEFKDYGDDSQVVLWLAGITHTGHFGGTASVPEVTFSSEWLANRVETDAGIPSIWRPRIKGILSETGGLTEVSYSDRECTRTNLPQSDHNNTKRCYPVWWTPPGLDEPEKDWFHKYVIDSVIATDTVGGSPEVYTFYEYSTDGGGTDVLWAWDDSEFSDEDHRTYNQWRGYTQVATVIGDPFYNNQLRSHTRHYRGMDGQPLPNGGKRSVSVTDSEGNSVTDHRALAGQVWETASYDGNSIVSSKTTRFWTNKTATRSHEGGDIEAWMVAPSREDSRQRLNSNTWQRAQSRTDYDQYGRPTTSHDIGDLAADDQRCTRTWYATNTSAWIFESIRRTETVAVACGATVSRPDDVLADSRIYYDGNTSLTASPTRGLPTRVDTLVDWDDGPQFITEATTIYDSQGRPIEATDATGATTTSQYVPSTGGPVTQTTVTNPLGHTSRTELHVAWGQPQRTIDHNGGVTEAAYDPLGRVTDVWLPNRNRGNQTPNKSFEYLIRGNGATAVTTKTMVAGEHYVTSIELYDGMLRPRQTQVQTHGGRLVTQTQYDSRGLVVVDSGATFNNESGPTTNLVAVERTNDISRTELEYDLAGRVTDEIFLIKDVEQWRTRMQYGGHSSAWMVRMTPPEGATPTAELTDARGNLIELREYQGSTPSGQYDATTYTYTPAGHLETVTDSESNTWSFEYDIAGRNTATDDPDAGRSTHTYNDAGQVLTSKDARGIELHYTYDQLNRQTEMWEGPVQTGQLLAEWTFDTATNGIGLPATATTWIDGEAWVEEIGRYDEAGRVMQNHWHLPDTAGALAGSHWRATTYHVDGSINTTRSSGIGQLRPETMIYGYNELGQPTRTAGTGPDFGAGKVYVDAVEYSPYGQLLQRTLGDPNDIGGSTGQVTQTWEFEEGTHRRAAFWLDKDSPGEYDGTRHSVAALTYEYDQSGNVLSVADDATHVSMSPERQCFQYDHLQRITAAWSQSGIGDCLASPTSADIGGPAPYWSSYTYDSTGNRTSETQWGPNGETIHEYAFPNDGAQPHTLQEVLRTGADEGRSVYTYDDSGNTTSIDRDGDLTILAWGPTGRVEKAENGEETTRFIDTIAGERLMRIDPDGSSTAWLAEYEVNIKSDGALSVTRYYHHAGDVIATRADRGDIVWMAGDHHGTALWSINGFSMIAQTRRMDPFGNQRGDTPTAWPDQRGFIGGIDNEHLGLTTIGAREYEPATGRFISVDPIATFWNPQQLNGYAYADNSPITKSDPTGLCAECIYFANPDGGTIFLAPTAPRKSGPGPKPPAPSCMEEFCPTVDTSGSQWTNWQWGDQKGCSTVGQDVSQFGECLPPVPVDAQEDDFLFALYCGQYGMPTDQCEWMANHYFNLSFSKVGEIADEIISDLIGITDIKECASGDWSSCAWAALNVIPIGRLAGYIGKAVSAVPWPWVNRACRSFVAGTLVLMADGSVKPIELVKSGHEVLAADVLTGQTEPAVVSEVHETPESVRNLVTITTGSPDAETVSEEITATAGHAFWAIDDPADAEATDGYWAPARDLAAGAWIKTSSGSWTQAAQVEHHETTTTTHSLTVESLHTFYVVSGENNLLNHNCKPANTIREDLRNLGNGNSKGTKLAKTEDELRGLFNRWVGDDAVNITPDSMGAGDSMWRLSDGTQIKWRSGSTSGGATIEYLLGDSTSKKSKWKRVHIEGG